MLSPVMKSSQTVLITGASGGIGLELARLFARDSYNLLLIARSQDKLSALKNELEASFGVKVTLLSKDLSQPSSAREIFDFTVSENIKINILVNNAGFGDWGFFSESRLEKLEEMISLNVLSLTSLCRLFLPEMIKDNYGKILNVASVASFMPGPKMAVYYATKAYVRSLTEALSVELKKTGSGVTVTALCPGPVKTDFWNRAEAEKSSISKNMLFADAPFIARYGYKALLKGRLLAIPGFFVRSAVFMTKLLPSSLVTRMVYSMQK
ncbi:MAG: SDR family oxidoreductase [Treponema sp.]|nr:SDR family oxidoreductase [Treponema sp.]